MRTQGRWWGLAAMVAALLVVGLDAMVLNVALPTLANQLGATTTELQWLTDSYTLAFAGLLLPAGLLGDRFGRKRFLIAAITLFGVSSVFAAYAGTIGELIWMRAVMGAGAAAIMPLTLSVLPSMFAKEERTKAVAMLTASVAVGLPLGPLVGGWLLQHFWWGSVFLINVPVAAIAVVGLVLLVPESKDPAAPRLDLTGTVLSVLAIVGVVYGIIQVPADGWSDPAVLVSLSVGVVALAGFLAWERKTSHPLVDLNLFRNKRFAWATGAATGVSFVMFGAFFLLPLYFQNVTGTGSMGTGLRLLPLVAGLMVGGLLSEKVAARFGVRAVVTAGLLLLGAGLLILATVEVGTGYGLVASALGVAGLGLGTSLAPAMDTVLGELPEAKTGVGSALASTCRQVGAALSIAILGSLFNTVDRAHLADGPRVAFVTGMSVVMWVCVAISALVAIAFAVFMPGRRTETEEPVSLTMAA
jgi:EmrB/QacA subfamily drug resistance transporter